MLPFKLVYHEDYDLRLGSHVFPSQKFRLLNEALLAENIAAPEDFLKPEPATDTDVLRVHTTDYVHQTETDTLSATEEMRLEIPSRPETVRAFWLAAGGVILAARQHAIEGCFAATSAADFITHIPATAKASA